MVEIFNMTLWEAFSYVSILVLVYFLVINFTYLCLVVVSFFHIRKRYKTLDVHKFPEVFENELYKSYSIIVPAYNEESEIIATVGYLLQQKYGDFEIVIVNDGSTDKTLQLLKENFDLYASNRHYFERLNHKRIKEVYASHIHPNLFIVDKDNGQRADAMNAGLEVARKDLFCAVDADSILEQDVLIKMLRSFAKDEDTIAVGGIIRVANGCSFKDKELKEIKTPPTFVACIQVIEYMRSFLFGRTGWDFFNGLILISGAFGVFDRKAVLQVGGYYKDAIGEDFELTVKLHRHFKKNDIPYRITFQPEPVCWTEVPSSWEELDSQRNRWQRGLLQTLWKYKDMTFNPQYGFIGLVAMPFYIFFELLGPVIELFGYIAITLLLITGFLSPATGLLFFIVAVLFGVVLSVASLLCDELTYRQYPRFKDVVKLILISIFESFGFRQLHTWWRCRGMVEYMIGNIGWNKSRNSPKLINAGHWIAFVLINIIIIYLFYYGITNGHQLI
jgi:cellulose synthase/poly-beta-1,6-N-acetylglucosamine synthase-like glycosyltransferase